VTGLVVGSARLLGGLAVSPTLGASGLAWRSAVSS